MTAKASFLSLPGELRNAIYEDVTAEALSTIHIHYGKVVLPALAFTCKQIWKEMGSTMKHSEQLATAEIHAEVLDFDCHKLLDFLTRFDHNWSRHTALRPVRLTLSFSAFTSHLERATGLAELLSRMRRSGKLDIGSEFTYETAPAKFFDERSGAQWAIRLCWSIYDDPYPVKIEQNCFMLTWGHISAHPDGQGLHLPGLDYVRDIGVLVEMLEMSLSGCAESYYDLSPYEAMRDVIDDFEVGQQQEMAPARLVKSAEEHLELRSHKESDLVCHKQNVKEPYRLAEVGRRSRRLAEQGRVINSLVASMSGLSLGV